MISLLEILHTIGEEKKKGLIPIDDWKWPDVDHLATMGFGFSDDYRMMTKKPPQMTVYKKKENLDNPSPNDTKGKRTSEVFYLEEEGDGGEQATEKKVKRFRNFSELIDYFDTYSQPEIDEKR